MIDKAEKNGRHHVPVVLLLKVLKGQVSQLELEEKLIEWFSLNLRTWDIIRIPIGLGSTGNPIFVRTLSMVRQYISQMPNVRET